MNYRYYMPTKVFMGENCIIEQSEQLKTLGSKAVIVTGANSAKKNGSEKDVITALQKAGLEYLVFDKVMSNPTIACAYEGAAFAKENGADFVVAIGGGSPMDAAKAMALLAAQDIPEENLFSGNYENKVLPMAFIPTTAGTGAEVTQYSILTNDKAQTKTSIVADLIFPTIAFLDARYMEDLSVTTTINTAVDALSHAVEGMLSVKASVISNALAKESMEIITSCVPHLIEAIKSKTVDSQKREKLLYASFLAGVVIAQTGTTAVHAMGYSLTYFKDIDHGRANGLLLGAYLKLVEKEQPELVKQILKAMDLGQVNQFDTMIELLLGEKEEISAEEISQFSNLAIKTRNIANCIVKPTEKEIYAMYEASLGS